MAGFDLSALVGDVSEMDTGRKQIEYIPLEKLREDPNNRYELNGIDELAANIEMLGLQQPLEVRPHSELEGCYTITSGHRRHAALRQLGVEEAPCIVVEAMASPALQELRLIFANSDTRRMSPAEQAWQAERIETLLYELKEQGYDFPGRMRDHVAAITKMSKSKLARLSVIRKNLKPEGLVKAFESGALNESAAYEIARRSELAQEMAEEQLDYICRRPADELAGIMDGLEKTAEQCKKEAAAFCVPGRMPQPQSVATETRREVEDYLAQRSKEDLDYFKLLEAHIDVFIDSLPLSLNRKERIDEFKRRFKTRGGGSNEFDYDGYAANGLRVGSVSKSVPKIARTWTEAYDLLCAAAMMRLRRELSKPACSNSDTGTKWQTGFPDHDCLVAGKFDCGGAVIKSVVIFKKSTERFYFESTKLPLDAECVSWVELPKE